MNYYSDDQVNQILQAYRRLFPTITDKLRQYWDLDEKEDWSGLVTDFHREDVSQLRNFALEYQKRISPSQTDIVRGQALMRLSREHHLGYSIGISPWTDDLVLRTVFQKTRDFILLLGHDWYSISNSKLGYYAKSPLQRQSLTDDGEYPFALKEEWLHMAEERDIGILFINLYPHFRPPAAGSTGNATDEVMYQRCVQGLIALLKATPYRCRGIITWGEDVFEAIYRTFKAEWSEAARKWPSSLLQRAMLSASGVPGPEIMISDGYSVPVFSFRHPSAENYGNKTKFTFPEHALAHEAIWLKLLAR